MATFTLFHQFAEDEANKVHNLSADTCKWMLTNSAPVQTNTVKANITEITAGNGYPAGGATAASPVVSRASGVTKFSANDTVITASTGSIGPFRYAVLYNDTPTSPADPLIGFLDYGSAITVTAGNTFTIDVQAAGIFTKTIP